MSRVGNQPVRLPKGVDVTISDVEVTIKGPKGSLTQRFHPDMKVSRENGSLKVERPSDERNHRALHGLTRSLLANMVTGVSDGFAKTVELVGMGYRAQQSGKGVTLSVMFSHTVEVQPREGITLEVEGNNRIHIRGINKQLVGSLAAQVRKVRPPNAYKEKGIRYSDEVLHLKPGKSAARKA